MSQQATSQACRYASLSQHRSWSTDEPWLRLFGVPPREHRRPGGHGCGSATYPGIIFLVAAVLICVAAAGQIAATRDEDAEGHVEHLVARRVGGLHWLAGRLLADVTLILVASLADEAADHTGLASFSC